MDPTLHLVVFDPSYLQRGNGCHLTPPTRQSHLPFLPIPFHFTFVFPFQQPIMTSWDYLDSFFSDMFTDVYDDSAAARPSFSDPAPAPLSMQSMSSPQFQSPMGQPSMGDKYQSSLGDNFQSSMGDQYHSNEDQYISQEPPREIPQQSQPIAPPQQQQQPPSPRKSLFDFVSPFDALANTSSIQKKKPVPQGPASASSTNEDSWTSASLVSLSNDPKRKSVENLMDQLTRSQPSYAGQPPSPTYYSTTDEYSQVESTPQLLQPRTMPPPLPPKPGRAPSPPKPERSSPPKPVAQQPRRPVESPLGQVHMPPMRREKDSSPGPRNTWKGEGRAKGPAKGKAQASPRQVCQISYPFFPLTLASLARNLKLLYSTYHSCWTMCKLLETP